MAIASIGHTAAAALQAYRTTAGQGTEPAASGSDFAGMLGRAMGDVVQQGREAETLSKQGIQGQGNLLDIVTAVSKAELSLQTTIAVRDRVVQAYQDIMRMPI